SRPEGNVTGVTFFAGTLVAKRVELLRELMPGSRSIAMLANTTNPNAQAELREIERAAQTLGLQFQVVTANSEHDIDAIFAGFRPTAPDAVFIQTDPFFQSRRDLIISLAARYK